MLRTGDKKVLKLEEIDFYSIPESSDGHVGFVNFIVKDLFALNGVAVYKRRNGGIRLIYPERRIKSGKNVVLVRPVTRDVGYEIEEQVYTVIKDKLK